MLEAVVHHPALHLRAPPFVLVSALEAVLPKNVRTVGTSRDDFCPADKPRTREEGLNVSRAIACHHAYLPAGFEDVVAGKNHLEEDRKKWFLNSSGSWYRRIQTDIFSEPYGETSYLQDYMRGKSLYENCRVAITNWTLEAKACEIVPTNENNAARALRLRNRATYLNAIAELQKAFKDAYASAVAEATRVLAIAQSPNKNEKKAAVPAEERARATTARPLFVKLAQEGIPSYYPDDAQFTNLAEIKDAKMLYLARRHEDERFDFWNDHIDSDVLATMFRLARGTVHLRTWISSVSYAKMWANRL